MFWGAGYWSGSGMLGGCQGAGGTTRPGHMRHVRLFGTVLRGKQMRSGARFLLQSTI
jgi:hypothetical protein